MKIPVTELVVGPHTLRIMTDQKQLKRMAKVHNEKKLAGAMDAERLLIVVDENLEPSIMKQTLLHEVLHTCYWFSAHFGGGGVPDEDSIEEYAVLGLESVLFMVMCDNKTFFNWIATKEGFE